MTLEFKKLYGIGCIVCDNRVFGPDDGVFPEDVPFDNIRHFLRQEAECEGWYTVERGGRTALVCSDECAKRWLSTVAEGVGTV